MFSLITYESGTIWCSAFVHAIWNVCMTTGILNVGPTASENSIYSYILHTKSPILTGGDYGVECSVFAILGYLVVALIAGISIRKKKRRHRVEG